MDELEKHEKQKYEKVWNRISAYRKTSPGLNLIDTAIKICKEYHVNSILDAGCGTGKATKRFHESGFNIEGVDITLSSLDDDILDYSLNIEFHEACLWSIKHLKARDCIYCVDVMEHIPEEKIDAVIDNLANKCNKIAIFQIALFHDGFGPLVGETTLHLTVKPEKWWEERILKRFKNIKKIEDIDKRFTFVCEVL
jgi:2-polyprenyl-3-methyl-5-hydroxy-6-metoxy-1,4-benzoquinol methylase